MRDRLDADHLFAKSQNPLAVYAADADHTVLRGLRVDRAFTAARVAEDRWHRCVSWKAKYVNVPSSQMRVGVNSVRALAP